MNSSLMSMTSLRSSKAETTQSSSPLHSKSTLMSLLLSRNAFLRPLSFKEFSTLVRIESTENALENAAEDAETCKKECKKKYYPVVPCKEKCGPLSQLFKKCKKCKKEQTPESN